MTKIFLTREQILNVPLRIEEIEVPEWGGSVFIREMTALEVEQNGKYIIKANGKPDYSKAMQIPTRQCVKQIVDADGKRLFADSDIKRLQQSQSAAISRIATAVRELSGQGDGRGDGVVAKWLEENYPKTWKEYQDETGAVAKAKENFT